MSRSEYTTHIDEETQLRVPIGAWLFGILLIIAVTVLVVTHFGEVQNFGKLLREAQPFWLVLALILQVGTYMSAGAVWKIVLEFGKKRLSLGILARLSVEKQTINQLIPTGGVVGNVFVVRSMQRYGVPSPLAIEAQLIDGLGFYIAYALVVAITLIIVAIEHEITPVIAWLIGVMSILLLMIPLLIIWLLHNRTWKPPHWIARLQFVTESLNAIAQVSPKNVVVPDLLVKTVLLHVAIFLFDSATLWAMLQATYTYVSPFTAFSALVIGSMAGTVSFIPGGIGSFEAGCIAALTLLGTPIEASLTATLLFRILTLWLPLVPGVAMTRQDLRKPHAVERN